MFKSILNFFKKPTFDDDDLPTESCSPSAEPQTYTGMGIFNYLDVSTIHITREDRSILLEMTENSWVSVVQHEFGHFVRVPVEWDDAVMNIADQNLSEAFMAIMTYAHYYGCSFVNFDGDGQILSRFEQFD